MTCYFTFNGMWMAMTSAWEKDSETKRGSGTYSHLHPLPFSYLFLFLLYLHTLTTNQKRQKKIGGKSVCVKREIRDMKKMSTPDAYAREINKLQRSPPSHPFPPHKLWSQFSVSFNWLGLCGKDGRDNDGGVRREDMEGQDVTYPYPRLTKTKLRKTALNTNNKKPRQI